VPTKLLVALIVEAPDGRVLDGSVHSFDLSVGPWVLYLGGTVVDVIPRAGELERVGPEQFAVCDGLLDQRHGRASGAGGCELDAVVSKHGIDLVGNGCDQAQQELP